MSRDDLKKKILEILRKRPDLDPLDLSLELGVGLEECGDVCVELINEGQIEERKWD
jgi:predicted transcriptional regulator